MFKILQMTKEHIDGVCTVENLCFKSPWTKEAFESEIENENAFYFAALDEKDDVVAYGGFWCVCGEGQITNIAVHPDMRRMHIGEALLDKIIDTALKLSAEFITLEVRVSNDAAQALYEKKGFKKVGIRKRYYKDNGEDAFLMLKNIG